MLNKKNHFIAFLLLFSSLSVYAAQFSGFVRDAKSGEVLIGANIWEQTQNTGTTTDNRGYFNFKVKSPCVLTVSYIGYNTQYIRLQTATDSLISVKLESENSLTEVTVTASRQKNYEVTRLSAKELSLIPTIGGKPDVIKALQLLPGVQSQSEGMSLMMVRGGEPGQNQYLLDNVP